MQKRVGASWGKALAFPSKKDKLGTILSLLLTFSCLHQGVYAQSCHERVKREKQNSKRHSQSRETALSSSSLPAGAFTYYVRNINPTSLVELSVTCFLSLLQQQPAALPELLVWPLVSFYWSRKAKNPGRSYYLLTLPIGLP